MAKKGFRKKKGAGCTSQQGTTTSRTPTVGTVMDRPSTITTLINLATRSPMLVAFMPANDNDAIYVGNSLTMYPSDQHWVNIGCLQMIMMPSTFIREGGNAVK